MTEPAVSRHTALYAEHAKLGASFTDFGGWQMPLKYSSELAEHHAVRKAAGLFDLSHMGEVQVTGPDAGAFLDFALVGKLSAVVEGKAKYSLICNADGGIIDDLISYRRSADNYLVVPNAGNAEVVARELAQRSAGFDVVVQDQSAITSLIALQGPDAEAILLTLVPAEQADTVRGLKYYASTDVQVHAGGGIIDGGMKGGGTEGGGGLMDVLLARTGYTGEDGFELYIPNAQAPALWKALLAAGGEKLIPAGLACRDSLRLEAGMPLYGNELSVDGDPYSAGLGPVVALSKESDFVGRPALEAKKASGAGKTTGRRLVGLQGMGRRAGRSHYPVTLDGTVVGEVTSGALSPTLGYPVALAYVDVEHIMPGTELSVDLRGKAEPFRVVDLPFYKREK